MYLLKFKFLTRLFNMKDKPKLTLKYIFIINLNLLC